MSHSNAELLKKLYHEFTLGNVPAILALCDDSCQFNVPGKSPLAGKYDKNAFATQFFPKLKELTEGTFKLTPHDIMASDQHGVVLASQAFTHKGAKVELRTVHVWRFQNSLPVAWYEYPRDLYRFDELFAQ